MKYTGYYDIEQNIEERYYPPAGKAKIDYISGVLAQNNELEIVSASGVSGGKSANGSSQKLGENINLRRFYSIGRKNKLMSYVSTRFLKLQFFCYLLTNVKKSEPIIVYHSLGYCDIIRWIKRIKHPKLILEMEEIYADVSGRLTERKKEMRLAACADAFIFPTRLLDDLVNNEHKPSVIVHGTYRVETNRHCNVFDDVENKKKKTIHCVYAGTLDPRKGGAIAAAAAEYLPFNYHIHILGFGGEKEVQEMKELVKDVQSRSEATISYDGLLSGEDYIRFIQSCDIGLSTQDPNAAFNFTSFPSKILSYLSNGLRVVSIRIPAIETSDVSELLYYYDKQTPEEIAKAILSVNMDDSYDSRGSIGALSEKFKKELSNMLKGY